VEQYLELLRSGGNDHPVSQMARAGVDFRSPEPVQALVATMERLVDQLEAAVE
jgi:oligoendopeptidase F